MAKKKQPKVFYSPLDQEGAATPVAPDAWAQSGQQLADEAVRAYNAEQASSFIDKAQAAWRAGGLSSAVARVVHTPDFDPVVGYKVPVGEANRYSEEEWGHVKSARSPEEYRYRQIQVEHDRADIEEMNQGGIGVGLLAGFVSMGPEAILTGWGVAGGLRAISAARYAAQGAEAFNAAASAGKGLQAAKAAEEAVLAGRASMTNMRSLLENVGGNIGATYIEDKLSPEYRVSAADYGMALIGGAIGHFAERGSIARDTAFAEDRQMLMGAVAEAYGLRNEFNVAARKELGESADDAMVKARATQMETEHFAKTLSTQQGRVTANRMFGLDLEKLEADELALDAALPKAVTAGDLPTPRMSDTDALINSMQKAPGVHADPSLPVAYAPVKAAMTSLAKQFLPNSTIVLRGVPEGSRNGRIRTVEGSNGIIIDVAPANGTDMVHTAVHELGHAIDYTYLKNAPPEIRAGVDAAYARMVAALKSGEVDVGVGMRRRITSQTPGEGIPADWPETYTTSQAEFIAEQFAKYVQEDAFNNGGKVDLPKWIIQNIKDAVKAIVELFSAAKKQGFLGPEAELTTFFDAVREGKIKQGPVQYTRAEVASDLPTRTDKSIDFLQDPIAIKYGLDFLPVETPTQRAAAKAMIELYRKADNTEAAWNNIPTEQLDLWITKTGFASTGITLLKSKNPVARMVAYELLEQGSGAGGRGDSASIAKYISKRKIVRNATNDIQDSYHDWASAQGVGKWEALSKGMHWERFNKEVGKELEGAAKEGHVASTDPHIQRAAAAARNAYERARMEQVNAKVTGWGGLPETSKGYMPHKMSPAAVINLTREQENNLRATLVDQFITIEGWDTSFSANLAAKYIDRIKSRARGGWQANLGQQQGSAAEEVEVALTAMGLPLDEVRAQLARYQRGAQGHLKSRIKLDLDQELGGGMTLRDIFEYDQVKLLTGQAERVSGEVALARHGIMGRPGMKLILESLRSHGGETKASVEEVGAFEQVFSEFLGEQIGNANKNVDRAIQLTSLIRMGGMGFNQLGEYINGIWKVGVGSTLETIGDFNRLRGEAAALARGEKVENSLLGSIETMYGTEFGTDAYRMHFPFGAADREIDTIQTSEQHLVDRLLRGGMEVQAKWSAWRAINAAQQRGFAEQLVLKTLRAVREGGMTKELQDIGITPELEALLKTHLDSAAKFGPDGRVAEFDVTKLPGEVADQYVQAIIRGTGQIIQHAHIGETGKWAHSSWARLFTQFRGFSLISTEKQWARNVNNHGAAGALGILLGSMALAAPIYMARVSAAAALRDDRDEYLNKMLTPEKIARASLNYVASSGFAGEFIDATASAIGYSPSGGRAQMGGGFVDSVVPVFGVAGDVAKTLTNLPKALEDGPDLYGLARLMPFNGLPGVTTAIGALKD